MKEKNNKLQITGGDLKRYLAYYFPREKCENILKLLQQRGEWRHRDMVFTISKLPNNEIAYFISGGNPMIIMSRLKRLHKLLMYMTPEERFRLGSKIICFSVESDIIKSYLNDLFSKEIIQQIIKILEERGIWTNGYIAIASRIVDNKSVYTIIKDSFYSNILAGLKFDSLEEGGDGLQLLSVKSIDDLKELLNIYLPKNIEKPIDSLHENGVWSDDYICIIKSALNTEIVYSIVGKSHDINKMRLSCLLNM